jgi:hypothetical protein
MTFPTIFTSALMHETASGSPVDSDTTIDGATRDTEWALPVVAFVVALGAPAKIFMCPFLDESRIAICEEASHCAFTRPPDCFAYFI